MNCSLNSPSNHCNHCNHLNTSHMRIHAHMHGASFPMCIPLACGYGRYGGYNHHGKRLYTVTTGALAVVTVVTSGRTL